MKLLSSAASPYSNKVVSAARYLGLAVKEIGIDTSSDPQALLEKNPLGKIPVLLLDDGTAIHDSVTIMHYLDRMTSGGLYPAGGKERLQSEVLEALCDGICDCLMAIIYERRSREQEKVQQPWIDRQWEKVRRTLENLNSEVPSVDAIPTGGHFALAATIDYLNLRFCGQWEHFGPKLVEWRSRFANG